jgi:predicted secreted protein
MAELHLNQTHNNKTVAANVGDTIIITLYETPTGYTWELSSFTQETLTFEQVTPTPVLQAGEGVRRTSEPPGAAGGGGQGFDWRFKAKAPGQGHVSIKYWRGYESEDSVFKYKVNFDIS